VPGEGVGVVAGVEVGVIPGEGVGVVPGVEVVSGEGVGVGVWPGDAVGDPAGDAAGEMVGVVPVVGGTPLVLVGLAWLPGFGEFAFCMK